MFRYLFKWLTTSLAVFLVPHLISGVRVDSFETALCVALVLGLLNLLIRPILFFVTLPITILTLGLFTFVLNALIFQLAAHLVSGFYIHNFAAAFWASLFVTCISWFLQLSVRREGSGPRIHVETFSSGGRRVRDVS